MNQFRKSRSTNASLAIAVPCCHYPHDFPTYQVASNESTVFGQRLTIVQQQSTYMPNEILNLTFDFFMRKRSDFVYK
ncbi:unnamed protein product, partial [Rotaria magnacalcarata]